MTIRILIITLIVLVCAAAVEGGVRVMNLAPSIDDAQDKFLSDPHLPWRVKPDWSTTWFLDSDPDCGCGHLRPWRCPEISLKKAGPEIIRADTLVIRTIRNPGQETGS